MKHNVENIKNFLIPVFSILLFAVYPVLALYAHNADELVLKQLVLPIIVSAVFSIILFVVWLIILKNNLKASLATVSFLLIFWNYGLIYVGITRMVELKHWHLVPISLFIYFHLVYFISKIKQQKTLDNLNTIVLVPISLLVLFNVITILPSEFRKSKLTNANHKVNSSKEKINGTDYPDIYLIILDECASLKTIKEEWRYDNNSLAEFLREKGFFVPENSKTRYTLTTWCMSSVLNLDYITGPVDNHTFMNFFYDPGSIKGTEKYDMLSKIDYNETLRMMGDNFLTTYLKEHGYKIFVLEGLSQGNHSLKFSNADFTFSYQNVNNKYSLFIEPFYMELIRESMIFSFDNLFKIDQTCARNYSGNKYILNYLKTEAPRIKGPKFIYAHIMCPHIPYVFDRNGNEISPITADGQRDGRFVKAKNTVNSAYLEQYLYLIKEIKDIAKNNTHLTYSQNPIIIMQSDHGPRPHELYLKDRTNSFQVFNAIYFPDGDYRNLYDSIAPVNTLRVVLNKYFGENYKMLEDR